MIWCSFLAVVSRTETGTDALSYSKQTLESALGSIGMEINDVIKFNELNITESFSGLSPTPTTFDPSKSSQLLNQAPLKPVDPVTKTFKFL